MGQLTLKVLQNDTNEALTDLEQRISENDARLGIVEDALAAEVDVAQTWSFDEDGESLQITVDTPAATLLPPWGIEIVEALIEALKGVRLQGAQEYALALEAKYFPPEEVESEEVVA